MRTNYLSSEDSQISDEACVKEAARNSERPTFFEVYECYRIETETCLVIGLTVNLNNP